jgi:Family of unknown function (DUF6152)
MRHPSALLCVALLALAASPRAGAHHGGAAYDLTRTITLEATIVRFDWANPHALISFTAPGATGGAAAWTAETAGPVILTRAGWTRSTLKPGDRVTVAGQPARNGSKTMLLQRVVFADGRTLTSFIPRFSGVWQIDEPRASFSSEAPPAMTPWAAARAAANRATVGPDAALDANDPTLDCVPPGVPYILVVPTPFEFVELPHQVIQLFEYSHFVRRIHLDGRTHPVGLRDAGTHEWLGHSIGRREGATLVVDTVGFNDVTWLDRLGRPHSDALHVVERITPIDGDTLDYRVTIDDPKAYLAPWSGRLTFKRRDGWEINEHTCVSEEAARYREYRERAWRPGTR